MDKFMAEYCIEKYFKTLEIAGHMSTPHIKAELFGKAKAYYSMLYVSGYLKLTMEDSNFWRGVY